MELEALLMDWTTVYRDTEKSIERRDTGTTDADGNAVWEERVTYANANEDTIRKAARQALGTNRTFLDLASPTNAQTLAQVKHLTRVSSALIRLQLADFDGTD
jgi:hypothetical protein